MPPVDEADAPAVNQASDAGPRAADDVDTFAAGNTGDDSDFIGDLGEKIGGARKDTADRGFKMRRRSEDEQDTRPAWQRRFKISQIVRAGGQINAVRDEGRWVIRDVRSVDRFGQARQVGRNTYATLEEAQATVPLAAVSLKHRVVVAAAEVAGQPQKFEIWREVSDRKRVKVVEQQFEDRDDAMRYMATHAGEIVETNTTFGEADLPLPPDRRRLGPQYRSGDVAGVDFMRTFALRGVEFGNWNNQDDRQSLMNDAYDGLMDLARVLQVQPRDLGLDGELALAFGARGHGLNSARAHYERARVVINLTKERGAGSLAHEWFHALDHWLARLDGKAPTQWKQEPDGTRTLPLVDPDYAYATVGHTKFSQLPTPMREALVGLVKNLFKRPEQHVEDVSRVEKFHGGALEDLRSKLAAFRRELAEQKDPRYWKRLNAPASAQQLARFDDIAQRMLSGDLQALTVEWRTLPSEASNARSKLSVKTRWTNDALEALGAIYKEVRGRGGFDATDRKGMCDGLVSPMNNFVARLKMLADAQSGSPKTRMVPTAYAMGAKELDQGRGGDYWTEPYEMAARAFQAYVDDAVDEQGGMSRFLNYAPQDAVILTPWGPKRPFPHGAERQEFNAAFERLAQQLRELLAQRQEMKQAQAQQQPAEAEEVQAAQAQAQRERCA